MAQKTFATAADLASLSYYSEKERAQVLACYLLDPRRFSMQDVAQIVLRDTNPQAGQRVSLITRSYGFSSRNAGRYAKSATEQDVWDFVRSYRPERTAGGLPEGTFDDFILGRQEQRRQRQREDALQRQRREEALRREQQRAQELRLAQEREEQRRMAELARFQEEERRRQEAEYRRQQELLQREQEKKRRAQDLYLQAAQYWDCGPGAAMAEGIRLFREARKISWMENGLRCCVQPSSQFYTACADMAESFWRSGDAAQALAYCAYLCDEDAFGRPDDAARRIFLSKSENGPIIGRGYELRTKIFLDPDSGYYDLEKGLQAADLGVPCRNPTCILRCAEYLEAGKGVAQDLDLAASHYSTLLDYPAFKDLAEARLKEINKQLLQKYTADITACLAAAAPEAFAAAGYEALPWEAYRDTVLDLPALWDAYQKAHSSVEVKGLLFKRKEYTYQGPLTRELFERVCRYIWESRCRQFSELSPSYAPTPGEQARADECLQKGSEKMEEQCYLEAASLLRLPALRGSLRARQALVELYTRHIQNQALLERALALLSPQADERSMPQLAYGFARLNDWEKALSCAEKAGEPHWSEIRRQAEKEIDSLLLQADGKAAERALDTYAKALRLRSGGHAALELAKKCQDVQKRREYLRLAALAGEGDAYYQTAQLELENGGSLDSVCALLEQADSHGALPDRELLAALYFKNKDYVRSAQTYLKTESVKDPGMCAEACLRAYDEVLQGGPANLFAWVWWPDFMKKVCETGSDSQKSLALYRLGAGYENGSVGELDEDRGREMIQESARMGCPDALCHLARSSFRSAAWNEALGWLDRISTPTEESAALRAQIEQARAKEQEEFDKLFEGTEEEPFTTGTAFFQPLEELLETPEEEGQLSEGSAFLQPLEELLETSEEGQPPEETALPQTPEEPEEAGQPSEEAALPQAPEEPEEAGLPPEEAEAAGDAETQAEKAPSKRKAAQAVTSVRLAGETSAVKNAAQAVTVSFQRLLQEHPDRLEDCLEAISQLTLDGSRTNSVFRSKAALEVAGRTVWLGLSTGFEMKCSMTDRLCQVLGLPAGTAAWFGPGGMAYENKGLCP